MLGPATRKARSPTVIAQFDRRTRTGDTNMVKPTQLRTEDFLEAVFRAVLRAVEGGTRSTADSPPGFQNPIKGLGLTLGIVFRPTDPVPIRTLN
jgi:hypothetical protein